MIFVYLFILISASIIERKLTGVGGQFPICENGKSLLHTTCDNQGNFLSFSIFLFCWKF